MPVETGDVLRIQVTNNQGSQNMVNTYHALVSGTQSSDSTIMTNIGSWVKSIYEEIVSFMPTSFSFGGYTVYNLTKNALIGEADIPDLTAGTSSANLIPTQVAPLIRLATTVLGSQGRKFFPAPTLDGLASNGAVGSSLSTALADAAAEILDGIDGLSWEAVLGNWNSDLARFAPYISALINTWACTQRRRRVGVGS